MSPIRKKISQNKYFFLTKAEFNASSKFSKGVYYPEIKIAPSLLSVDYRKLEHEIRDVEKAGVEILHVDIMDGHFVPNITIGPAVVKDIRKITKLTLDVHLMISNPDDFIPKFISAGADIITFHIECYIRERKLELRKLVRTIKKLNSVRYGLVINPSTDIHYFKKLVSEFGLNFILIMSVNPGFGGQKFIKDVLKKARILRKNYGYQGDLEIDGGINSSTAREALKSGCNILVAGSYIFKAKNRKDRIAKLESLAKKYRCNHCNQT
jgi:ribulose-phosphate 3-epimerase